MVNLWLVRHALPLVAGVRQTIPDAYDRILRVLGNATTPASNARRRRAVTVVSRDLMDTAVPAWRDPIKLAQQVDHVMFDETDPRHFEVYPANDGTGALAVTASARHTELTVIAARR